ncbi:hypothetical protein K3G39_07505 [Pontibacter sp. HSC-14F20]|uniref:hypothetical protein n=1 Tax=Pontibacter sp. HSC-14F20 TaxID=2864136 RepID=UPI001C734343|nr:hypothetical protein [Pontibacter sp. HSC-14F20]MBX0333080.1 hypothetical protein [Pontibacter sp. HSC-14F20]
MKNQDNFHEKKRDSGHLGKESDKKKISDKPAPKSADRESETTSPDNEVYVNLEPDELHIGDEEIDIEDVSDLSDKDERKNKKKK